LLVELKRLEFISGTELEKYIYKGKYRILISFREENSMKSSQMGFNPDYAEDAPTLEQC